MNLLVKFLLESDAWIISTAKGPYEKDFGDEVRVVDLDWEKDFSEIDALAQLKSCFEFKDAPLEFSQITNFSVHNPTFPEDHLVFRLVLPSSMSREMVFALTGLVNFCAGLRVFSGKYAKVLIFDPNWPEFQEAPESAEQEGADGDIQPRVFIRYNKQWKPPDET